MKRFVTAIAIGAAALLAGAGTASATGYNNDVAVGVDNSSPAPGGTFTVTVTECTVGTEVTFVFDGTTKTDVADADGASATFTAPSTDGTVSGTATCGDAVLSFGVTVTTPTTTAPTGQIPETGNSGTGTTMGIAALLLVAGAAMFGVAQVRRRQATTA